VNLEWAQKIARQNIIATYMDTARGVAETQVSREDGFVWCHSEQEASFANMILGFHEPQSVWSMKQALERTSKGRYLPRAFVIPGDEPKMLEQILTTSGYGWNHDQDIWVYQNEDDFFAKEPKSTVRVCENDAEKDEVIGMMLHEFFAHRSHQYRELVRQATLFAGSKFYSATIDGKMIGSAMVKITEESAGIYNLCIDPMHRHSGFGSEIVAKIVEDAISEEKVPTLQCDEPLGDFYRQQNFIKVGKLRCFVAFRQKLR